MKITIDTADIGVLDTFEEHDHEAKDKMHRRWGRISWLYPNDMVVEVSGESAIAIRKGLEAEEPNITGKKSPK